jgi:hypothetical protein
MRRSKSTESICIHKIERGIISIKNGHRDGEAVGSDLDFFFDKLKEINEPMYNDLFGKYCMVRLERENTLKVSV